VAQDDGFVALGAGGRHVDRHPAQSFDALQVAARQIERSLIVRRGKNRKKCSDIRGDATAQFELLGNCFFLRVLSDRWRTVALLHTALFDLRNVWVLAC